MDQHSNLHCQGPDFFVCIASGRAPTPILMRIWTPSSLLSRSRDDHLGEHGAKARALVADMETTFRRQRSLVCFMPRPDAARCSRHFARPRSTNDICGRAADEAPQLERAARSAAARRPATPHTKFSLELQLLRIVHRQNRHARPLQRALYKHGHRQLDRRSAATLATTIARAF